MVDSGSVSLHEIGGKWRPGWWGELLWIKVSGEVVPTPQPRVSPAVGVRWHHLRDGGVLEEKRTEWQDLFLTSRALCSRLKKKKKETKKSRTSGWSRQPAKGTRNKQGFLHNAIRGMYFCNVAGRDDKSECRPPFLLVFFRDVSGISGSALPHLGSEALERRSATLLST